MSEQGFVMIHRTLLGHHAFRNDSEAMAFAWMILRASWRDAQVRYKGRSIALSRGQLAVSVRDMAEALDRPKGWVERFLTRLKAGTMVRTDSETGVLIITICNYDVYQAEIDEGKTVRKTSAGRAQDSDRTQNKEGNKGIREDTNVSSTPPTPSPKSKAVSAGAFVRPVWADAQVWSDLLTNRKTKRLPNTATAYAKFLRDIDALADAHWPPGKLLEAIVARGWGAAYDPRPKDYGNGNQQQHRDTRDGYIRELDNRLGLDAAGGPARAAGR